MFKIRCSGLGRIMAKPREKGKVLSEGAKTYISELAKQHVYNFTKQVSTREIQKGLIVEPESIALLNDVLFSSFAKNAERRQNDWLTGECDICTGSAIHDIKSSWSLSTFPATPSEGESNDYEWQLRGYMMLWDADQAELDYCMVDTPDELIGYEDESLHKVSHIDPLLRVTRLQFTRTQEAEDLIKYKVEAAQKYFVQAIEEIYASHS